jgi:acyl transferase domain-containing protein
VLESNGRTGGISHPSEEGQEAVIRQAFRNAGGLNPDLTGYFECVRSFLMIARQLD